MKAIITGTTGMVGKVLPWWTTAFVFLKWGAFIVLVVLNWKYALVLYVFLFAMRVLPVLEWIGQFIMRPFLIDSKK